MSKMQVTSVKKGRAEEKQKPNEDTHGRGGCGVFSGCERWWGGGDFHFPRDSPLCHCLLEDAARSCKAK